MAQSQAEGQLLTVHFKSQYWAQNCITLYNIRALDSCTKCTFSKFSGDTKWGVAGAPDGCVVTQKDLNGSTGEMGQKESCEVQQGKIPSLAPKEK